MEKKVNYKVLGLPTVTNKNGKIIVQYDTIFSANKTDMDFLHDVTEIGIHVFNFWGKRMHVLLPKGWAHIRVEKNRELIIDDKGRPRISINKKGETYLLRRFDFIITHLGYEQKGNKTKHVIIVQLTDAGHVISEHPLDDETIQDVLKNDAENDESILMEQAKEAVAMYLGQHYPNWKNPLAYWEE
jgi:hypothetical protein